jgi:Niemann-Pick C1 protein
VALCGEEWSSSKVCCTPEQVTDLSSNLAIASSILSLCPACKKNFFNFFCTSTCSSDQSTFLNVTSTLSPAGKSETVGSVHHLVAEDFGEAFFDSCKEVKFSTTNGFVMDFIGGGVLHQRRARNCLGS